MDPKVEMIVCIIRQGFGDVFDTGILDPERNAFYVFFVEGSVFIFRTVEDEDIVLGRVESFRKQALHLVFDIQFIARRDGIAAFLVKILADLDPVR